MAPKVLITGGTGYIGGTVLDTVVKAHPEYDITAYLRNEPKGFSERYPNVNTVKGDYDSIDILTEAASKADIVIHNGNSDHLPSLRAIVDGLLSRSTTTFLIHLSGTGIVADWHDPTYLGKLNPKIWSDVEDIDEITSRPDGELHRHTDKYIQEMAAKHGDNLKTAIMCPPDIYGPGRGPGKTNSILLSVFLNEIAKIGAPFYTGEGMNTRSWVHVEDLMTVYMKVVEAAANGGEGADWGREGYYFSSSQETSQIDLARAVGEILKKYGHLQDSEPRQLPLDIIKGMVSEHSIKDLGVYAFAASSRSRADRATKLFGYSPEAPGFWDSLEAELLVEL